MLKDFELDQISLFDLCENDVEKMWNLFKQEVLSSEERHIPKIKDLSTFKKKWSMPLYEDRHNLIRKKHRLWAKYNRSKDKTIQREYKKIGMYRNPAPARPDSGRFYQIRLNPAPAGFCKLLPDFGAGFRHLQWLQVCPKVVFIFIYLQVCHQSACSAQQETF